MGTDANCTVELVVLPPKERGARCLMGVVVPLAQLGIPPPAAGDYSSQRAVRRRGGGRPFLTGLGVKGWSRSRGERWRRG